MGDDPKIESGKTFIVRFNAKTAPHAEAIQHALDTNEPPYTINRGLRTREVKDETVLGYNETLPRFRGQTFAQILDERSAEGATGVQVLDMGYGNGQLLADITKEYPKVQAIGFGRSAFTRLNAEAQGIEPTVALLESNPQIKLIEGDLPFTPEQIPSDSLDVACANNVFLYIPEPVQKTVIKDTYRTLKPGGVALFNQVGFTTESDALSFLNSIGVAKAEFSISANPNIGKTLAFGK